MDGEATRRHNNQAGRRCYGLRLSGLGVRISRMMKEKRLVWEGREQMSRAAGLRWLASNGGFSVVGAVVYLLWQLFAELGSVVRCSLGGGMAIAVVGDQGVASDDEGKGGLEGWKRSRVFGSAFRRDEWPDGLRMG